MKDFFLTLQLTCKRTSVNEYLPIGIVGGLSYLPILPAVLVDIGLFLFLNDSTLKYIK